ncbi:transposase [Paraburkholderia sp. UCT70]
MKRFIEGKDRKQAVLLPEYLEDYVSEDNPVRVIDVFVDELDLHELGFDGTAPATTGRPPHIIYPYGVVTLARWSAKMT